MLSLLIPLFAQASAAIASGAVKPSPLAPSEIVAAAPAADWVAIAPSDLVVMDLTPSNGKPRRVVIQLMPPPFSQGWVGNIRKLAAAHWWDGAAVARVQDNYVAQWGDPNGETPKAKPLPPGLATVPESDYVVSAERMPKSFQWQYLREIARNIGSGAERSSRFVDNYAGTTSFFSGWPVAVGRSGDQNIWPVHCYGMVGVGRNLSPDTGSGAELYAVIGHAPRHLDRNIALVGRVIAGIEYLSSLPRGTEALGFYKTPEERTPIVSVRMGTAVAGLAAYQYLSTESTTFARYADARANRKDAFFNVPAGGADICNIPVPVRVAP